MSHARSVRPVILTLTVVCSSALANAAAAGDWTRWGGPNGNFTVNAEGLADSWPADGPKRLWNRELGDGYSTILADGDALYTMYRIDQDEFTVALDARSGATLWEHKVASSTTDLMEQFGAGPSSTPLIVGDRLYSVGTNMMFHCFDKKTGKVLWKYDLVKKFKSTVPGRGYAASPIHYKGTIIMQIGGEDTGGQSLAAFDAETGSVVWKNQSYQRTHSSPLMINFKGEDQLVAFFGEELVGLDPNNGELIWRHPHKTQYGANISTPVFDGDDTLFCSAAYDSGARAVRLKKEGGKTVPEELWYSRKFRLHHGDAIIIDGHVYGSSGDFGPAFFIAMNLETGEVDWRKRGFKKATCVYAGGKMIILDEDGKLALATVSPAGMELHGECTVGEAYAWAAPTVVGDKLFIRDRKHISAFDIGK